MSSTQVSPETEYIDDVISMMRVGELSIPQFQRPYVWEEKDIIDLFDSLYRGYPIGSILVWECNHEIPSVKFTNEKSESHDSKSRKKNRYIIDGQQRLTSLFCSLNRNHTKSSELWDIYFDLNKEEFYHGKDNNYRECSISLKSLISTGAYLKETGELLRKYDDETLIDKAQILADRIRKYKISIINLVGGELRDAIEIFTRLNKKGKELDPMDLISALNYETSNQFSLFKTEINNLLEKYSFTAVENDFVIKLLKILSDFKFYSKKDFDLAELCSNFRLDNGVIDLSLKSLDETLSFFVNDLMFDSIKSLPFSNTFFMVLMYIFDRNKKELPIDYKRLKKEFYLISFKDLPNTNPSGIEKLISFFGNDFDIACLTDSLIELYKGDVPLLYNELSARSAQLKLLFNLIINYCSSFNINICDDDFCYPPKNIDKGTARLGNKTFFQSKNFMAYECIIYSHIFGDCKTKLSLLEREKMYNQIYLLGAKQYC
ncbi:TPA: DUF262 domain-containing protein [Vibrio parahaemolyticus]